MTAHPLELAAVKQAVNAGWPAGCLRLHAVTVARKPWWVRLLEFLKLRRPVWKVTYVFEVKELPAPTAAA